MSLLSLRYQRISRVNSPRQLVLLINNRAPLFRPGWAWAGTGHDWKDLTTVAGSNTAVAAER
jgi:hypothetical protein